MIASHFKEALSFIKNYQGLADCNLVDFLTHNLWKTCLPETLRLELENIQTAQKIGAEENCDFNRLTRLSPKLNDFIENASSLSLKNSQSVTKLDDFLPVVPELKNSKENLMNFMSNKKQHEITVLSQLVGYLAKKHKIRLVIDAGTGKGYLSTSICQSDGLVVLGIDSSESNVKGAINRQKTVTKNNLKTLNLARYSIHHIDENTDYKKIIEAEFDDPKMSDRCILTGLHTCGQLAHSMIRSFANSDCIRCLCVVPCCYHLTKESLTGQCNFTKNARMIAQQSVERSEFKGRTNSYHPPSLFYRALLQIILQSLGIPDTRIGRGAPTRDFPTYVDWALTKIKVDRDKIPSVEDLNQLYETHLDSQWRFNVFQSMRIHLGSVLEAAIVLDRVTHLEANSQCSELALIQLFDPLISPRCYAIVASK